MFLRYTGHRADLRTSCKLCGAKRMRKGSFKLRDGPIDWWFCDDECCSAWLEHRHCSVLLNQLLGLQHRDRVKWVERFGHRVALQTISQLYSVDEEAATPSPRPAAVRLLSNLDLPLRADLELSLA